MIFSFLIFGNKIDIFGKLLVRAYQPDFKYFIHVICNGKLLNIDFIISKINKCRF